MRTIARALFVSDVHLGTPNCQARYLLRLLDQVQASKIYLVGDIIDLQAMSARAYWHPTHSAVIHRLMNLVESGVEVIYIPGNHDALLRRFHGQTFGGIKILREALHTAPDGSRYCIRHGDELDPTRQGKRWIESLGETLYASICWVNRWYNAARSNMRMDYSPLSVNVKRRVRKAMEFIHGFEERALAAAKSESVDGYICGHIHHATIRQQNGLLYLNDGDWVEHCTVLCEPPDGGFELWQFTEQSRLLAQVPPRWWQQEQLLPSAA